MRQVDLTDRGKTLSGRNYLLLRRAPITYRSFRAMTPSTLALKESAISLSSLTPLFASHSIVFGRWALVSACLRAPSMRRAIRPVPLAISSYRTRCNWDLALGTSRSS